MRVRACPSSFVPLADVQTSSLYFRNWCVAVCLIPTSLLNTRGVFFSLFFAKGWGKSPKLLETSCRSEYSDYASFYSLNISLFCGFYRTPLRVHAFIGACA
ncbi:hypothetical protein FRC18_004402 [Serendipita sp. 400]|nr:hypothetical protein FRC18_004402 [Serendipita sp. 400]